MRRVVDHGTLAGRRALHGFRGWLMEKRLPTPWLAYGRPHADPRLRLFCLPYAGGGASAYLGWKRELPADMELCLVQLPGRETRVREPAFRRMVPLVEAAAVALHPFLDRPFSLFGHSMGALVAFELARHLRARYALAPEQLFVSGHGAPQLEHVSTLRHDLPEPEFIAALARLNGTPREVLAEPKMLELMLPLVRADCEVCDTYDCQEEAPFDFPIRALGGTDDSDVSLAALEAWREHTSAEFDVRLFPGGHFYLSEAPTQVLSMLSRAFER